jgi:superfamily II DNA/RNA helicase
MVISWHSHTAGIILYAGFKTPTPVQEKIIPRLLNKENIVLSASTGSGTC